MEEFVAHRNKYNSWGDNRADIENKFNDAKKWLTGYEEQGWGGWPWGGGGQTTTYQSRTDYFYQFIGNQWKLGTAKALTVNKNKQDVAITMNGIKLSENTFDGKFFAKRTINLIGTVADESKAVTGWKVTGAINKEIAGSELSLQMPNGDIAISPIIGTSTDVQGIDLAEKDKTHSPLYDLQGNKVDTPQTGKIYIQNGKKAFRR